MSPVQTSKEKDSSPHQEIESVIMMEKYRTYENQLEVERTNSMKLHGQLNELT